LPKHTLPPLGRLTRLRRLGSLHCSGTLVVGGDLSAGAETPRPLRVIGGRRRKKSAPGACSLVVRPGRWFLFLREGAPNLGYTSDKIARLIACHEELAVQAVELDAAAKPLSKVSCAPGLLALCDGARREEFEPTSIAANQETPAVFDDGYFAIEVGTEGSFEEGLSPFQAGVFVDASEDTRLVSVEITPLAQMLDDDEGDMFASGVSGRRS
jgi:hypothetical protein